jgi:UPF0176 protein
MSVRIAALYKFVTVEDLASLKETLTATGEALGVKGTLLIANEGLNGTIAAKAEALDQMIGHLKADKRFCDLDVKYSHAEEMPFLRYKVRLKSEIVTLGVNGVDPTQSVGTYIAPENWNDVLEDPDTVVIDTRNDYEVGLGTFKGAIDPKTKSFREFPDWVAANKEALKGKRVAMFCTGGIRCEKASSYMLSEGFDEVLHLKGGILKYLETQKPDESLWKGDCFVFDNRVAVSHGLEETDWVLCHACRMPISEDDRQSPNYEPGVRCPSCADLEVNRQRHAERQKQIELAQSRGEKHLARKA